MTRGVRGARRPWVLPALLALAGCESLGFGAEASPGAAGPAVVTEAAAPRPGIVDLSQPLDPGIPYFPGGVPFTVETIADIESGYYSRRFSMGEHTGTHVDAPGHFVAGQGLLDTLHARDLIAPLVVIDVREQCRRDPDFALDLDTVGAWERRHGPVPDGAVVALHTGWAARWGDPERYRNADAAGVLHFPGYSAAVSEFLARNRRVRALGIDTLSTDVGATRTFAQHKTFLKYGTYQIENLRNLEHVPPTGATIVVGVLPIGAGSGAPARVFAIVPADATP